MSKGRIAVLQDVVGINTDHKGLSVRLLRSASLLGLLYLYRFGFVVGVLHVRPHHGKLFCILSVASCYWYEQQPLDHQVLAYLESA